jgi:hypothetical protein
LRCSIFTEDYRPGAVGLYGCGLRALTRFCFALQIFAANDLGAQASPYVPLDDIAYRYVDAVMARGGFRQLSALERPYTVGALLSAIDNARSRGPSARVTDYLDALEIVIGKYSVRPRRPINHRPMDVMILQPCILSIDGEIISGCGEGSREQASDTAESFPFRTRGTVNLYATGQTSGRRELMLADDSSSVRPAGTIRVMMAGGPIAGSIRPIIDTRLNADPEFSGRKDRRVTGRTEDGYLSGQWKYGELFLGRAGRNWGPSTLQGLQVGNYAYTYDHLYGRVGSDKLHWATVIARLEDYRDAAGLVTQRYFSIHRLAVRRAAWEIAATESYLYSGAGRGFEPSLANPFNIYSLSFRNEGQEGNLGLGLEAAFRSKVGTLAGHAFLDDLQIDRCDPNCEEPSSYGLTLSAEGLPLAGDQRWFASYSRVSYLAYRTPNPNERYAVFNVGLGQGFSDFDEVRVGLDIALLPRTPLLLYAAHRRQGEGDYRAAYPAAADYATTPGIFGGVIMKMNRLALSGASRFADFEVSGDAGFNRVKNYGHVAGTSRNGFEGRVRMAWEPRVSVSF